MITKQELIQVLTREFTITTKVFRALPTDQLTFRPHEKSRSASELIGILITELTMMQGMSEGIMNQGVTDDSEAVTALDKGIALFEQKYRQLITVLQAMPSGDLEKPFNFFGNETTRLNAIHELLYDFIHHRGQFSVYIRLAGGKVPAMYGPSADDQMGA